MPAWLTVIGWIVAGLFGGGGIVAFMRARGQVGKDRASAEVIIQRATAAAIDNVNRTAAYAQASAEAARAEANAAHADAERSRQLAADNIAAAVAAQGRVRYLEEEVAHARVQITRLQEQLMEMSAQMESERRMFQRRFLDETTLPVRRNGIA